MHNDEIAAFKDFTLQLKRLADAVEASVPNRVLSVPAASHVDSDASAVDNPLDNPVTSGHASDK